MKKIKPSNYVRYLGIYLDEYLNWSPNHLSHKLVEANPMLLRLDHFVNVAAIKSICNAVSYSNLSYVCAAYGKNLNSKHCVNFLQKKPDN